MSLFVANMLLAIAWAISFGGLSVANLGVGFVLGFVVLWATGARSRDHLYFRKTFAAVMFLSHFLKELVVANLRMMKITLGPLRGVKPAILAVPLDEGMSDLEITTLANMITLTPGTLSLDVSADRRALFVHFIHVDDAEAELRSIEDGFKRPLLGITR